MRTAAATAAVALLLLAGCGGEARDLFLVERSGSVPGARLSLRITDDGRASCNGADLVDVTSDQLIAARESTRDVEDFAKARLRLPAGRNAVFSYRLRTEEGTVTWSDTSARQPPVLFKVAKVTRDVAKGPCRLAR